MRQSILLTLLGLAGYAFFLLITLPMSLALDWSGKLPADVTTYGIEGSVMDGRADALIWQNWRFERLQWQFAPLEMLSGRLGYHLSFTNPDGSGSANAGIGLGNSIHLDQLALRLPLSQLSQQWPSSNRFGGDLEADLSEFSIEDGRIDAASGSLLWSAAHLRSDPPTALGSFRAELQAVGQDGEVLFRGPVSDTGGALSASGQLELNTEGLWQIHSKLALRTSASPRGNTALAALFNSLGRVGADGKLDFALQGQLPLPEPQSADDSETGPEAE